ncbi:MAG: AraC family transcriptional regulator [Succinivibrio sp.]
MEWLAALKATVSYLEEHLFEENCASAVASEVGISSVYLNKGFEIITGMTISSYVKRRRLYLSVFDIVRGDKIIDVAFKCGYETPESFSKAFSRFHGISPLKVKKSPSSIRVFLPLNFKINITGGEKMDVRFELTDEMTLVGFSKRVSFSNSFEEIPKYWKEIYNESTVKLVKGEREPSSELDKAIVTNMIGMFGASYDSSDNDFMYGIFGVLNENYNDSIPEELVTYKLKKGLYAKFTSTGPLPHSLQALVKNIFSSWLPGNVEYELSEGPVLEYYPKGDCSSDSYSCEVWVPVKKKNKTSKVN